MTQNQAYYDQQSHRSALDVPTHNHNFTNPFGTAFKATLGWALALFVVWFIPTLIFVIMVVGAASSK